MSERQVVLDQPRIIDEQSDALRHATERAEAAEAELAKLKAHKPVPHTSGPEENGPRSTKSTPEDLKDADGVEELRKDSMMATCWILLRPGRTSATTGG